MENETIKIPYDLEVHPLGDNGEIDVLPASNKNLLSSSVSKKKVLAVYYMYFTNLKCKISLLKIIIDEYKIIISFLICICIGMKSNVFNFICI